MKNKSPINEGSFPIKKGQSIWLELKATEDTDLMSCKDLCEIYFKNKVIDKLSVEGIIFKESYFDDLKLQHGQELVELLIENGFIKGDR